MIVKFYSHAERECSALIFPAAISYCFEDFCGICDLADAAKRHFETLNYHKINFDLFSPFRFFSLVSLRTSYARAYYIIKDIIPLFERIIKGRRRHRCRPDF